MKEKTKLITIILIFAACYYVPWAHPTIRTSGLEAFMMLREYAREHVLTCLIPAFFIAGAIGVFVSQASVLKYFGATARKILSYSVASVSGSIPDFPCPGRSRAMQRNRRHRTETVESQSTTEPACPCRNRSGGSPDPSSR